ncbi:MAG: GIY-YIG nuclease family protein [Desulfobacterales bacterium]|nr:MAG: GIY-YIG nuclease family protein [Desulfobacterales bacterium]
MYYVYMLRSVPDPKQTYVGFTEDLKSRLSAHNNGQSSHTSKYKPWELITYDALKGRARALEFEKY